MKSLSQHIQEALKVGSKSKVNAFNYHPKTRIELKELVEKLIEERGNDADLNDIDTSEITDMSSLFYNSEFNGDISKWNMGKVKNIFFMFANSIFNGDISGWDVSSVEDMSAMFQNSKFNGDISDWDVSSVKDMRVIFSKSPLKKNPPAWWHN